MTVKELIDGLQKWVDNGTTKLDEEVFVCTDWLSYDESELFDATFHSMNAPIFDKSNPTKRAICFGITARVPNDQIIDNNGEKRSWYGSGSDIIEIIGEKKPHEIAYEIAKSKVKHLQEFITRFENHEYDNE